jgi:hypothetical protein
MPDWFWPAVLGASVVLGWVAYVAWQEHLSRIRFPDERHEHGPFGP